MKIRQHFWIFKFHK